MASKKYLVQRGSGKLGLSKSPNKYETLYKGISSKINAAASSEFRSFLPGDIVFGPIDTGSITSTTTTTTTTLAPSSSTTTTTTLAPSSSTTTSTTSTTTTAAPSTTTTSTTSTTTTAAPSTTTTTTIAPNTFNVSNDGSSAYIINGSSNPTLSITEGQTYTFNINASGHPFWIKTVNSTGTGNAYNSGVTNNGTDNGTITFIVPYDAPSTLYYNCQFHSSMAGIINVIDVPITTTSTTTTTTTELVDYMVTETNDQIITEDNNNIIT
jgi:hypothetical protein